jgi:tetratricopeptide (TPR) repeat protein
MAKPQIVTLPFVLLLWDYWPLQRYSGQMSAEPAPGGLPAACTPRSIRFLVWEKFSLFVLAAADCVVTLIAQRRGLAIRTVAEVAVPARLENALVSYVRYLGKAFWPAGLAPMYPRSQGPLPLWQVLGAAALLLLVTAAVLRWRHRRYLPVGWFWFLGTLVPMIGMITVGDQAMADRYAYIPFIGVYVAVVWTLDATASKYRIPDAWRGAAALLVVLVLGCLTYRQVGRWRDPETLWRYALTVTEGNYTAHDNLSLALALQGRHDEAIAEFQAATALHKYPPSKILLLAFYELRVGHPQDAIEVCESVLRESADPKIQAAAWSEIGQGHLQLGRYDQAAVGYRNALRLNPEDSEALVGTGLLAMRLGQFDLAATQLAHGVKEDPRDVNVLLLAQALRRAGRTAEADAALARVQKISPDLSQAQAGAEQLLAFAGLKPQ